MWSTDQQEAFDLLKIAKTLVLVLAFSDISILFYIKADSLDFAMEAVFS